MESSNSNDSKQKQYFRLTITYSDGCLKYVSRIG